MTDIRDARETLLDTLLRLYPAEAALKLRDLDVGEVTELLKSRNVETASKVFACLNPDVAVQVMMRFDDAFFLSLFTVLDPGHAIHLLARLSAEDRKARLRLFPANVRRDMEIQLEYPSDTAGGIMDSA